MAVTNALTDLFAQIAMIPFIAIFYSTNRASNGRGSFDI
jgi:hypothetical protein